jgi:Fe-S-cluster containining protein
VIELEKYYRVVVPHVCPNGGCGDCCIRTGQLEMLKEEFQAIKKRLSRISRKELLDRRDNLNSLPDDSCPLLDRERKCLVYEVRPLICRMFGNHPRMRCVHSENLQLVEYRHLTVVKEYFSKARPFDLKKLLPPEKFKVSDSKCHSVFNSSGDRVNGQPKIHVFDPERFSEPCGFH